MPPAGAALFSATVQVVLAPVVKAVGLHVSEVRVNGDTRLIVAVWETPPKVAVSVAL